MLCQKVHLTFHPKNFCNVALQNCLNFLKMNCYCFLLPTFTYITLLSLQKEGESQVSSHFFVSPTKLTGLSMFFCNTCYLIATRYPCREKISGKERRAWELQHDIKMHIRNIFFMRRKHLPNADWILLTPLFSCITKILH